MRRVMALLLTALLLAACAGPAKAPPAGGSRAKAGNGPEAGAGADPAAAPPTPPGQIAPIRITDWIPEAPNALADRLPLTADLPTFPPMANRPYMQSTNDPGLPKPGARAADERLTLGRLAAALDAGQPSTDDAMSTYVGALEDGNFVYMLGGMPTRGVDSQFFYILKRGSDGWTATPICHGAWMAWAWPGIKAQKENPVAICATIEGSGGVLTLLAYKGDREVLRVQGLEESGFQVSDTNRTDPPEIVAYGAIRWLSHKLMPYVTERFTFTFRNGQYHLTKQERMADWTYHVARFKALVAAGDLARAALEMAEPPKGGLAAYLAANAEPLPRYAGVVWAAVKYPNPGTQEGEAVFTLDAPAGPIFTFDLASDGRIKAIRWQPGS